MIKMELDRKRILQILFWIAIGSHGMLEAVPVNTDVTTIEKLQNTIEAMELLLEKQQKRMLSGFEGMRRRVYTLEKIAEKTKKEMESFGIDNALCSPLVAPNNGRVLGGLSKAPGDRAYIVCNDGFQRFGDEEKICLENGTWTGRLAECRGSLPGSQPLPTIIEIVQQSSICRLSADGSRICTCPRGFQMSTDKTVCTDVDECAVGGSNLVWKNNCQYKCRNLPGSYECICPPGYGITKMKMCEDIDECAIGNHNCNLSAECINTKGGYRCVTTSCPPQMVKTSKRTCGKILCPRNDVVCARRPDSITTHYMAIPSKVGVPVAIFKLTADNRYTRSLSRFSMTTGGDNNYFRLRRHDYNSAWLFLRQQPIGPLILRSEFEAKQYQNGSVLSLHKARVILFVSEYTF